MTMTLTMKYVDELAGGRKRFRRRWPKDVAEVRGEAFYQKPLRARSGPSLITEWQTLLDEFEATVAQHRASQEELDKLSPRERWEVAQREADRLLEGVRHSDEEVVRTVLADDLAEREADPLLYRAVIQPDAPAPAHTLADAFTLYGKQKIAPTAGRSQKNRLERVRKKTEAALGELKELRMVDLKRHHGRDLLEHLQSSITSTGKPLSPSTIRRELDMVRAIVELALLEFDLANEVSNPFRKLDVRKADDAPTVDRNARLPLPVEVIAKVRERLSRSRKPELSLIWRLLEGTGCRLSEVGGLRVEDVRLDHPTPH